MADKFGNKEELKKITRREELTTSFDHKHKKKERRKENEFTSVWPSGK